MSFEIERGRPIPTNRHSNPFPLDQMNVGDSFDVEHKIVSVGTVSSRLSSHNRRNPATKFITRQVNKQGRGKLTRVWRVR